MEFNELGSVSLSDSPGSCSYTPADHGIALPCISAPLPPSSTRLLWGCGGRCRTIEACQSDWAEPIKSPQKLGKLMVLLKKHRVHPKPKLT